ncbi:hypothetical protein DIPPA_05231 [Diplonema papillatum]|nr:hypothetical protein DIPPA_05231 [Diplonema papillatum]
MPEEHANSSLSTLLVSDWSSDSDASPAESRRAPSKRSRDEAAGDGGGASAAKRAKRDGGFFGSCLRCFFVFAARWSPWAKVEDRGPASERVDAPDGAVCVPIAVEEHASEPGEQRTGFDKVMVLMRHSVRLDSVGYEAASAELWPDKATRPHNSPIVDFDTPRATAALLRKYKIQRIVSSPYLRCLQTAGIVASELGRSTVHVDDRLGEWYAAKQRCFHHAKLPVDDTLFGKTEIEAVLAKTETKLGDLHRCLIGPEDTYCVAERVQSVMASIISDASAANTLVVTHGDIANRYLPESDFIPEYSSIRLEENGFVAIRQPIGDRAIQQDIIEQHLTESL